MHVSMKKLSMGKPSLNKCMSIYSHSWDLPATWHFYIYVSEHVDLQPIGSAADTDAHQSSHYMKTDLLRVRSYSMRTLG